jgi:radical SAM superfamily enzyme YgiQ (UPF0313 family)
MHPPSTPDTTPVVLVSCYELGHQPLGLAVPGGVLERAGIPVAYNDIAIEKMDESLLASASLIGISVPMHTALRLGVKVAQRARRLNPDAHICFYGLYAALNEDYLRDHVADSCLGAECEGELLALARRILSGEGDGGEVATVGPRPASRDLDLTPQRGRLLGNHHYVQVDDGRARRPVGYTVTTRGCKHTCRHCPITPVYGGRFYAIPVDAVMADIETLVDAGATHITFGDPDFLNGPGHARRVAAALHRSHPRVTFDYTAKVEHLHAHRDVVEELAGLGNLFVVTALESMNDEVLRHLGKGHTRSTALAVMRHFRAIGLTLRPTLVPFTPWETLDSFRMLLDTVAAEGAVDAIDAVQYTIRLLVPPGSPLLDSAAMAPHLGSLDEPNFSYRWTHPDPRMDQLQHQLAATVEAAVGAGQDRVDTFVSVYQATAAGSGSGGVTTPGPAATRTPGLTEAWFC